jgi:hypothetical protein
VSALSRSLQWAGLLVTGIGFFDGVFGGRVRRELVMLAVGAALFFLGRAIETRRR